LGCGCVEEGPKPEITKRGEGSSFLGSKWQLGSRTETERREARGLLGKRKRKRGRRLRDLPSRDNNWERWQLYLSNTQRGTAPEKREGEGKHEGLHGRKETSQLPGITTISSQRKEGEEY